MSPVFGHYDNMLPAEENKKLVIFDETYFMTNLYRKHLLESTALPRAY
jgi:hypothetical protein